MEGIIVCPGQPLFTIPCHRTRYETGEDDVPTSFCGYVRPDQDVLDYSDYARDQYRTWRAVRELRSAGTAP